MSNVDLSIGGRNFTVACADGEEAHVTGLGRMIDERLAAMGGAGGQNESRMLLFAALLLADELHEARRTASAPPPAAAPDIAPRLEALAAGVENLAARLESCADRA